MRLIPLSERLTPRPSASGVWIHLDTRIWNWFQFRLPKNLVEISILTRTINDHVVIY